MPGGSNIDRSFDPSSGPPNSQPINFLNFLRVIVSRAWSSSCHGGEGTYYENKETGRKISTDFYTALEANEKELYTAKKGAMADVEQKPTSWGTSTRGGSSAGMGNVYTGKSASPADLVSQIPISNQQIADIARSNQGASTSSWLPIDNAKPIPIKSYALGIDRVPTNQLAFLHEGEKVTPASENRGLLKRPDVVSAGGNATVHVSINAPFNMHGKISSDFDLMKAFDQYKHQLETRIGKIACDAVRDAIGRRRT